MHVLLNVCVNIGSDDLHTENLLQMCQNLPTPVKKVLAVAIYH